ncbi:MAG: hypothetical protein EZS28_031507, partial [Streblomastix strix]
SQTYCVSILAVLGMLHIVVDRAREAKREEKEYGGCFMIFGDVMILIRLSSHSNLTHALSSAFTFVSQKTGVQGFLGAPANEGEYCHNTYVSLPVSAADPEITRAHCLVEAFDP